MLVTHEPTRGPWELSDKSPLLVIGYEPRLYPENERCTIARVDPNGDKIPTEVSEANARLIAAAPELLVALKALTLHVHGFEGPCPREKCACAFCKANEAIAKAEGRVLHQPKS